jgi:predicted nucleotide-binding protein (sugar kinase/HSP70/actin superfamily)
MNSKVKQALREGATVGDISAGLAYSVIKNSLYKVLKLKDPAELGERIVVQGGTFRNPAILRAFELLIGRDVVRPDCAEVMGAYGAALTALQNQQSQPDSLTAFPGIDQKAMETVAAKQTFPCAGCENRCTVTQIRFVGGRRYVTGNRCERRFSNGAQAGRQGENLFTTRRKLLFERCGDPDGSPILTFGIPRVLNMYENFPFWCTLLRSCGFRVVLSGPSEMEQYEKGIATVMSDSICFPGKVVHGHILDLIEKGVDRIFYPQVLYEDREGPDAQNCYNCPVVTGYPDVVKSAIDPDGRYGVPIDSPVVAFRDVTLLKKQIHRFLKKFGIGKRRVDEAVEQGIEEKRELQREMHRQAARVMEQAAERHAFCVVVSGRPYHADPLINHGLPELLAGLGVDVIPGSAIPLAADRGLKGVSVLTQGAYTNRIFGVAKVAAHTPSLQLLQITSFGCGLDAISVDETREIMRAAGKIYTLIKMDEIANLGAVRIRLRSMLDAIRERSETGRPGKEDHEAEGPPGGNVAGRTVLIPWFSPFYSPFIPLSSRRSAAGSNCSPPRIAPPWRRA